MNFSLLAVILATVSLSALAQIALKSGMSAAHMVERADTSAPALLVAAASSPLVWLGLAIYGISVLAWLWVLSKIDVSVAYPFVGLSFLLTSALGAILLHEHVTPLRAMGTLLVICGCVLIARSA